MNILKELEHGQKNKEDLNKLKLKHFRCKGGNDRWKKNVKQTASDITHNLVEKRAL